MNVKVSVGLFTDKGPVRDLNEDAGGFITAKEALDGVDGVFVVADGLGGHDGGEVASKMAVEAVLDAYRVGSTEIDRSFLIPFSSFTSFTSLFTKLGDV